MATTGTQKKRIFQITRTFTVERTFYAHATSEADALAKSDEWKEEPAEELTCDVLKTTVFDTEIEADD